MATNVNKKFVVIVSVIVLALVAGAGGLVAYTQQKSAERNIERGEQFSQQADDALAAGDAPLAYELRNRAQRQFGSAVAKDSTNLEYLERWREELRQTKPDTRSRYEQLYNEYLGAMLNIAQLQREDPEDQLEAQVKYVELQQDRVRALGGFGNDESLAFFIVTVTEALERIDEELAEDPRTALLRGYRGLAQAQRMRLTAVDPEDRDQALADLEFAYEKNPGDVHIGAGIVDWHIAESATLSAQGRSLDAAEAYSRAVEAAAALREAHPESPVALARYMIVSAQDPRMRTMPVEDRNALNRRLARESAEFVDLALALDEDEFDMQTVGAIGNLIIRAGREDAVEFIERMVEGNADSVQHLFYAAQLYDALLEYDRGIEVLQRVVDMPMPELSLDGVLLPNARVRAGITQGAMAAEKARRAQTAEEREDALESAVAFREAVEPQVSSVNETDFDLMSAQILLLEGKTREARAIFERLRSSVGDQPALMLGLARCAAALGNGELAQDYYERLLDAAPIVAGGRRSAEYALELASVYAANGRYDSAVNTLAEIRDVFGDSPALRNAEDRFRQIAVGQARIELAELERAQQQFEPGTRAYSDAEIRIETMRARLDGLGADEEPAGVVAVLADAAIAQRADDNERAEELYRSALDDYPDDSRPYATYARFLLSNDRREDALDVLEAGLERFPSERVLNQMKVLAETDDPYEMQLEIIESDTRLSEAQKLAEKAKLAARSGRRDEAERLVAQADERFPEDPATIDVLFNFAVTETPPDMARAREIADRAAATDADQLEGLTYRGRAAMAEGDFAEAARLFEEATDRIPTEPEHWRQWGRALSSAGRFAEALEKFERALEGRSADPELALDYARTLQAAGRPGEALAMIGPEAEGAIFTATRANPQMRELWLTLEASAGNRERAIEERASVFEENPANGANALRYVVLLNEAGRFGEAREAIERIAQTDGAAEALGAVIGRPGSVALTTLRTETLAAQGDPAAGEALWADRIETLSAETDDASPYLAYAQYLFSHAQSDESYEQRGFDVLEQGRSVQSPTRREADRALAEAALQRAQRFTQAQVVAESRGNAENAERFAELSERYNTQAIEAVRVVLEEAELSEAERAGFRRSLARAHLALDNESATRSVVEQMLAEDNGDLDALLLLATLESRAGDEGAARVAMNRAVEANPTNPQAFLARASLNREEPALFADVVADLDRAAELDPTNRQGWAMRFNIYAERGNLDQAFADLREAIGDFAGAADTLRFEFVSRLQEVGRVADATEQALIYADESVDDDRWQSTAAQLALRNDRFGDAARVLRRLYESPRVQGQPERLRQIAGLLLDAQIRAGQTPSRGEVYRLIEAMTSGPINGVAPEDNIMIIMLEARARDAVGEAGPATGLIQRAWELVETPADFDRWYAELELARGDRAPAVLARLAGDQPSVAIRTRLLQSGIQSGRASDPIAAAEALLSEARAEQDLRTELLLARTLATLYYTAGRYEDLITIANRGLEINPADWELNNFVAFTMVKHLDQAEEALPYATTAYTVAQDNPAVLDTVGLVWLRNGRAEEAVRALRRAETLAEAPELLLPINAHLAEALLALDQPNEAMAALSDAKRAARTANPAVLQEYQADIDRIDAQLRE